MEHDMRRGGVLNLMWQVFNMSFCFVKLQYSKALKHSSDKNVVLRDLVYRLLSV